MDESDEEMDDIAYFHLQRLQHRNREILNLVNSLFHANANVVRTQNWDLEKKLLSDENFDVPDEPHFTKMIKYEHNFCYNCKQNEPHFHFEPKEKKKTKK